jgi:hypothetical protein
LKAKLRFHQKVMAVRRPGEIAVAELKVWQVPKSTHYPDGLKFSLFLVERESGEVLVGFDNHQPKGPHLHRDGKEAPYSFRSVEELLEDFWSLVAEEGFTL